MHTTRPTRLSNTHTLTTWLLLAGLTAFSSALLTASDRVTLQLGSQQRAFAGRIIKENSDEISMLDERGQSMPGLSWKQVVNVTWDIPQYEWNAGMSAFESKDYAKAASSFKRIDAHYPDFREAARSTLLYYYAQSLRHGGDVPKAMAVYERLLSDFPRSHYFKESSARLASLYLMTGHADKLELLAQKVSACGTLGEEQGELYRADALFAAGKFDNADLGYRRLETLARDREIQQLARLGQARCANRAGRSEEAASLARETIQSKSATQRVYAQAHLVLGNALRIDARAVHGEPAQNLCKDAALEFMRVSLMYPQFGRIASEATYQAAEAFQFLAKSADRDVNLYRAYAMYKKVQDKYASSTWAAEASKSLKRL